MQASRTIRRSKVVTLQEAASLVTGGMTLAVGGNLSNNAPCALVREIIRQDIKNLTIIPTNNAGYQVDILIGAGCVKKLYMSYIGLDYLGFASNFRRLSESGKLNVVDLCEAGLFRAQKAACSGIAFFPLPDGMKAVDTIRTNPDFYREVEDPYTGKKIVVVPPLKSDVAIIHMAKCDAFGNARREGMFLEDLLYMAADKVIISTEELVPLEDTLAHYKEVKIPGYSVDAVVEAPYGGHPGECAGYYILDDEHMREFQKAGREESTFKKYLDEWVYQPKNQEEYLEKLGQARLLKLRYR